MGFGILLPVCLTSFNTYFREKRAALMSASSVVAGLGAMFYPMTIKWLMEVYGFRGTLIIIAAINVHLIPIITIFRPVEWSYIPKKTKKYSGMIILAFETIKK